MKYIFVIPSICNIGGAQLYLVNKINYLEENGWDVDVIYARKDICRIKQLEKYIHNCFPYINYSTMYYRQSYVESKVNNICRKLAVSPEEEVILESCTVSISTWAEIIASKLGAKHICFAFEELFEMSRSQLDFAYYKHIRHELAGISDYAVPLMFKNSKYVIQSPEVYGARPLPSIGDVEHSLTSQLTSYDIVIGSFGRLDKGFVWTALEEMKQYYERRSKGKYAVLLIGDTKDNLFKKKIYALFEGLADVYITGEIWPVSRELVKCVNVFVSTSGAASSTAIEGVPTIAINPETFKPNGILDYTTSCTLNDPHPDHRLINELLEDIIDKNYCKFHQSKGLYVDFYKKKRLENWAEFDRQMTIAQDYRAPKEYYDVFKISLEGKRKYASYISKIFGFKAFVKVIAFAQKYYGTLIRG